MINESVSPLVYVRDAGFGVTVFNDEISLRDLSREIKNDTRIFFDACIFHGRVSYAVEFTTDGKRRRDTGDAIVLVISALLSVRLRSVWLYPVEKR